MHCDAMSNFWSRDPDLPPGQDVSELVQDLCLMEPPQLLGVGCGAEWGWGRGHGIEHSLTSKDLLIFTSSIASTCEG